MKRFLSILLIGILLGCKTRQLPIFYSSYEVEDYSFIVDSIKNSGTTVGEWKLYIFVLDDERKDSVYFAPLYKGDEAVGSIQVREVPEFKVFNVQIVDESLW